MLCDAQRTGQSGRTAIKGLSDDEVEIDVISGLREEILPELQKKIADGIEIVVAGGANARIVRGFLQYSGAGNIGSAVAVTRESATQRLHPAVCTIQGRAF